MSEIAKAHTLVLQFKASKRFPSMLKNTGDMRVSEANSLTTHCTLVRSVFDMSKNTKKAIIVASLFIIILINSCEPQKQKTEPFCGDNICQDNEKENCAADCGGFEGVTKLECANAKGSWNDCGSPCAGTGAEFCIQVCSQQCECGGIAGFKCPEGYKCRLTGKIADKLGVCVKE